MRFLGAAGKEGVTAEEMTEEVTEVGATAVETEVVVRVVAVKAADLA